MDDEPWRRGGSRTHPAVLRTASRPASPAPRPRADSNGRPRSSEPRALSTAPRGHKVRREGLEPPCGMPDLQSGAVAAAPPTLGVTSQDRTGSLRDHRPALCRLSYSHRAQRRNRTSVPWVWTRCSPIELAEPARSRRDLTPLRPASQAGSSTASDSATVLSEGIGPPSPGCGPGALPLS